ncbi:LPS O-antigen chain length determinant protein WzzB [Vibrio minamisatsumaniensis]|uniref:LPS O-antigen chain length determinant protein WzzB n=1 Tax=Vibrio minamisatsumaniensis TaxID=2910243 RepID=UPI003D21744C
MYSSNDEIDLRELFKALWDGKIIIILLTALFAASSVGYALSAQEWWSSSAKITQSELQDRQMYQQQVKQFQSIFADSGELSNLADSHVIFNKFVDLFNSRNNKQAFLEQSAEFQDIKNSYFSNASEITEDVTRKFYLTWLDKVSASLDDKKRYVLTFQSMTKKSSFNLLKTYISFTESQVREDLFDHLEALVFGERNELIQQEKLIESEAKNKLNAQIEQTQSALKIAKAASINAPLLVSSARGLYEIELGSKALQEKVKELKTVKNLTILEPRLQLVMGQLHVIDSIKIDRTVEFKMFRYLSDVEQPITRDKPKRALIVVLGTLLGGMLGVAIVLIRFAFRKED